MCLHDFLQKTMRHTHSESKILYSFYLFLISFFCHPTKYNFQFFLQVQIIQGIASKSGAKHIRTFSGNLGPLSEACTRKCVHSQEPAGRGGLRPLLKPLPLVPGVRGNGQTLTIGKSVNKKEQAYSFLQRMPSPGRADIFGRQPSCLQTTLYKLPGSGSALSCKPRSTSTCTWF